MNKLEQQVIEHLEHLDLQPHQRTALINSIKTRGFADNKVKAKVMDILQQQQVLLTNLAYGQQQRQMRFKQHQKKVAHILADFEQKLATIRRQIPQAKTLDKV